MGHDRFDYSAIVKRPPLRWPEGKRVAVWFIPNIEYYELGGFVPAKIPWFAGRGLDVINYGWQDYGLRVGIWRIMDIFDKHGVRGTVALNSAVCEHNPDVITAGKERQWEFMGHGVTNSQFLGPLSEADERSGIKRTVETITQNIGQAPQGWLGPGLAESAATPDLLAEHGIRYLCDWCNDDQPYPMRVKTGRMISVPYTLELNDIAFFTGTGATGDDYRQAITDAFDTVYAEGVVSGRVLAVALHPFITGAPHIAKYLERAVAYICDHDDVWITTGGEIADWYYAHYYPKPVK